MNWIKSQIAKLLLRHAVNAAGAWFITKGFLSNDDLEKLCGALAVLVAIGHSIWDKRTDIIVELKKLTATVPVVVIAGSLLALTATGCSTAIKQGDIISITQRGFGLHLTATSSTTQTPEIMAGIFSQTVQLIPTATNAPLYSPNFANSASVGNSLSPFSLAGDENTASGNFQTSHGTNIVQQPVVPK